MASQVFVLDVATRIVYRARPTVITHTSQSGSGVEPGFHDTGNVHYHGTRRYTKLLATP
jgi:hypothetical protein